MKKYRRSSNGIFLMELLLNILLFAVLLIIGLQFFIKAHTVTQNTTELHYGVTLCENVASIFESKESQGDIIEISELYPYCTNMKDQLFIYYDDNFEECRKNEATYYILVTKDISNASSFLSSAKISLYSNNEKEIYSLTAFHYQPLTPSLKGPNLS